MWYSKYLIFQRDVERLCIRRGAERKSSLPGGDGVERRERYGSGVRRRKGIIKGR